MPTLTRMEIRNLRSLDWPEVARIYEDGIRTGNATFETGVPSWESWDAAHSEHRLVVELMVPTEESISPDHSVHEILRLPGESRRPHDTDV